MRSQNDMVSSCVQSMSFAFFSMVITNYSLWVFMLGKEKNCCGKGCRQLGALRASRLTEPEASIFTQEPGG